MAICSSILAWGARMDRGAWWAALHGVTRSWTRLSAHACGKHAPRRPGCALVVGACWGSFPQPPSIRKPHPAFFWAQVGSRSGQAQRTCQPSGRFQRKPAVPFVLLRARKHALLSRMLSSLSFSVLLFFLWFS